MALTPQRAGAGHSFALPTVIANYSLFRLKDHLFFPMLVNKSFQQYFEGGKGIGNEILIKRPYYARAQRGRLIGTNRNRIIDKVISLKVDKEAYVAMDILPQDPTFNISEDEFVERYIDPQMEELAYFYNQDGLDDLFGKSHIMDGTPGTGFSAAASQRMLTHSVEMAIPSNNRSYAIFDVQEAMQITLEMQGRENFNNSDSLINQAVRTNFVGQIARHTMFSSPLIPDLVVAPLPSSAAPKVMGANQRGNAITIDSWGVNNTKVLNKGQLIQIAGVGEVKPRLRDGDGNKVGTGRTMTFVVKEDVTTNGSGVASVKIEPEIIGKTASMDTVNNPSGIYVDGDDEGTLANLDATAFQNVTDVPADNAVVTVVGRKSADDNKERIYRQGCFFNGNCSEYVSIHSALPKSATEKAFAYDKETGMAVTYLRDFEINNRSETARMDILYGTDLIYPALVVRFIGSEKG